MEALQPPGAAPPAPAAAKPPLSGPNSKPPSSSMRSFADVLSASPSLTEVSIAVKQPEQYRGYPAVSFSKEEVQILAAPFKFALVGKFSRGGPTMDALRKEFVMVGFRGSFSLGLLDSRHVLIRFDLEEDYHRCWLRGIWTLQGFVMRVLKWTPSFSIESESSLVPVWIRFPGLPLHLYSKIPLFSIASTLGEPLRMDASTAALTRPSVARICVELDLLKSLPEKVWVRNGKVGYWQPVEYENVPEYCAVCYKIGHSKASCRHGKQTALTEQPLQDVSTQKKEGLLWTRKDKIGSDNTNSDQLKESGLGGNVETNNKNDLHVASTSNVDQLIPFPEQNKISPTFLDDQQLRNSPSLPQIRVALMDDHQLTKTLVTRPVQLDGFVGGRAASGEEPPRQEQDGSDVETDEEMEISNAFGALQSLEEEGNDYILEQVQTARASPHLAALPSSQQQQRRVIPEAVPNQQAALMVKNPVGRPPKAKQKNKDTLTMETNAQAKYSLRSNVKST